MKIILDNGHGINTPGKRSPYYGGIKLYEWEFNRDIVNRISRMLLQSGFSDVVILTDTIYDKSLGQRVSEVNNIHGEKILFSIHANAGGGTGFEVFTSIGETKSDTYATVLFQEFEKEFPNERTRRDMSDGDVDKESQFYILKYTNCPAVLSENFFMDNEHDFKIITSYDGREKIARYHFNAIQRILNQTK